MSKLDCEVVRDLLPLYKDKLCSDVTAGLVDDHLEGCETCTSEYEAMCQEVLLEGKVKIDAKDSFKKFVKKVNRKRLIYLLIGIVAAAIICFGSPVVYQAVIYDCSVIIPYDDLTISEIYMTPEGYIRVHVNVDGYIVTAMRSPGESNLTFYRRHFMPEMTSGFQRTMKRQQTLNDVWISWNSKNGDLIYGDTSGNTIWTKADNIKIHKDGQDYQPLKYEGAMTTLYELEQYNKYGAD